MMNEFECVAVESTGGRVSTGCLYGRSCLSDSADFHFRGVLLEEMDDRVRGPLQLRAAASAPLIRRDPAAPRRRRAAYAIQDNQLWLRLLLTTFFAKILAAGYAIFVASSSGSGSSSLAMLPAASWLMFVVGVVKYGERIWALYNGHLSTIRSTIEKQKQEEAKREKKRGDSEQGGARDPPTPPAVSKKDPDYALLQAHANFGACKAALVDISWDEKATIDQWRWDETWVVLQMELSLLYDIMYTKAGVIHTWHGYCIRVFSPLATAGALVMFHLSLHGALGHGAMLVDVAITYTLLVGAVLVDTWWLLMAAGSTWAYAFLIRMPRRGWLYHTAICGGRWRQVRRVLAWIRWLVNAEDSRRWSGTIWQHNMLQFCTRDLAKKIHVEWRKKDNTYSGTTVIPDCVMEQVFNYLIDILRIDDKYKDDEAQKDKNEDEPPTGQSGIPLDSTGLLKAERGWRILKKLAKKEGHKDGHKKVNDLFGRLLRDEIQQQIIIWHIATDIYLRTSEKVETTEYVKAINLISNYMMFVVVERPYMVPGLALRTIYSKTIEDIIQSRIGSSVQSLAEKLSANNRKHNKVSLSALPLALLLVKRLNEYDGARLEFLFKVWVEMLHYVSHRCSRESHAKQLSSGGELTTVVWIMAEHARNFYISKKNLD
ncbi:Os04g0143200 [Oryza sativa Japonica Group]|uniref:Os04g0143200 protein n=2 Tax=Oryza sativa subsp. japonica TaxID=39947 RepID=A0A0P0W7B7_ORYSJ|nr:Os04g0143200 [Oryza sativa Japonica Group]